MKQLQQFVPNFQTYRSKMKVKAAKEPLYLKYEAELMKMIEQMTKFVDFSCGDLLAEAETMTVDTTPDIIETTANQLQATYACLEHHLIGAKAAKLRFAAMLT